MVSCLVAESRLPVVFQLAFPYRRDFRLCLALLVVAAMAHCAWEAPAAAQQLAAAANCRTRELPLSSDSGCHNESGCICRGATLVAAISVGPGPAACHHLLPPPQSDLAFVHERTLRSSTADLLKPPSAYGRQLRALYASLVL